MQNSNFPPPSFDFEEQGKALKAGVFMFAITCLVYSLALYLFLWISRELNIVDLDLNWRKISLFVFVFQVIRIWDRAFMRIPR